MTRIRMLQSLGPAALACVALVFGCRAPSASKDGDGQGIERLAWLTGAWTHTRTEPGSEPILLEERWGPPAGGTLFGVGRVVVGSRTEFFEYLRIEEQGTDIVYIASPRGLHETRFRMVSCAPDAVVFENAAHNDPKRISYRLESDGSLYARTDSRLDGVGNFQEFRWQRER
jgi:hypothetical protein